MFLPPRRRDTRRVIPIELACSTSRETGRFCGLFLALRGPLCGWRPVQGSDHHWAHMSGRNRAPEVSLAFPCGAPPLHVRTPVPDPQGARVSLWVGSCWPATQSPMASMHLGDQSALARPRGKELDANPAPAIRPFIWGVG